MTLLLVLCCLLLANVRYVLTEGYQKDYLDSINAGWSTYYDADKEEGEMYSQVDTEILTAFSKTFEMLERNGRMDGCDKCKSRLALGKILAMNKPHLVPSVFMEWCLRKGYGEVDCRIRFNRKESHHTDVNKKSDFTNLLQLIDAYGKDGDMFCYYHDEECTNEPEQAEDTAQIMQSWYPPTPPGKLTAPQSSAFDTFHVLHLSDLDYQIDYLIGAEANCSQEICCIHCGFNERKAPADWNYGGLTPAQKFLTSYYNSSYDLEGNFVRGPFVDVFLPAFKGTWDPARSFGSYRCGVPEVMIDNVLKTAANLNMREEIDFDFQYVILTGGLQVRSNTFDETVRSEQLMLQKLKKNFDYTPVILALGKHDTYPDNQMAQYTSGKSKEFGWNEEILGDLFLEQGCISNDEFRTMKTHNGAYAITTEYGLKIITLNSNFYNSENYYCFWNTTDVDQFGQVQFLVNELLESEANDQRVWIIGSLPLSSPQALPFQAEILANVINRFSPGTIAEVFFGDRHQDGYNILYDDNGKSEAAVAGAWIAPSVSPLHGANPGFRYYEIDARTFNVLNAYTYYTPLDQLELNGGDEPEWLELYSTRYEYTHGDESFWPAEAPLNATFWDKVLKEKIRDKLEYKQAYQRNKSKNSPFTAVCSEERFYTQCELSYCEIHSFTFEQFECCVKETYPALFEQATLHPH